MVKRVLMVLVAFAAIALVPVPAADAAVACIGAPDDEPNGGLYNEARIFMESQGWWVQDPAVKGGAGNGGHVHIATCYPLYNPATDSPHVSGVLPFRYKLTMFDNPGTLDVVHNEICLGDAQSSCVNVGVDDNPNMTCAPQAVCSMWWPPSGNRLVDTTLATNDGKVYLRTEARTTQPFPVHHPACDPKCVINKTSHNWPIYLQNNKPLAPGVTSVQGKGWYRTQPELLGAYNFATVTDIAALYPLFTQTSGNVNMQAKCSGGSPIDDCLATVDPDFHMGNEGQIIRQWTGTNPRSITVVFSNYAAGPHVLVIRSQSIIDGMDDPDCNNPSFVFCPATRAGILKVPFVVGP